MVQLNHLESSVVEAVTINTFKLQI